MDLHGKGKKGTKQYKGNYDQPTRKKENTNAEEKKTNKPQRPEIFDEYGLSHLAFDTQCVALMTGSSL